mmetsp:Transcript_10525/g.29957  ORF Transcript_10525/g.29957 Transcript_10525/m.29957 type:complete len:243 (-) Transcript_10525:892-1620(-)
MLVVELEGVHGVNLSAAVDGGDGVQDGLVEVVDEDLAVARCRGNHERPEGRPAACKQVLLARLQLHDWRHLQHVAHSEGPVCSAGGKHVSLERGAVEVMDRARVCSIVRLHGAPQLRHVALGDIRGKVVGHCLVVVKHALEHGAALCPSHEGGVVVLLGSLEGKCRPSPQHHRVAAGVSVDQLIPVDWVLQPRPLPDQNAAFVAQSDDVVRLVLVGVACSRFGVVLPADLADGLAVRGIGIL